MANTALNRSVVEVMTNKSGQDLVQGDVVIVYTGSASAVTVITGSAGYVTNQVGVVIEPNGILNNAQGLIAFAGYVPKINLDTSGLIGQKLKISGTGKKASPFSGGGGEFGQLFTAGTSPDGLLFGTFVKFSEDYICIADRKTSGTAGGTFSNGAWRTRDLNTEIADTGNNASVASNQITLAAGTYRVRAIAPAVAVDRHQTRLYDTTGAAVLLYGTSEYCAAANNVANHSFVEGRFTISVQSVIEVQHRCQSSNATSGFGIASGGGFGVDFETYTVIELWKE